MSAKDQVTKMLDQLMGQNRDGEWILLAYGEGVFWKVCQSINSVSVLYF